MDLRDVEAAASIKNDETNIDCNHPSIAKARDVVNSFLNNATGTIIAQLTGVAEHIQLASNIFGEDGPAFCKIVNLIQHYKAYTNYAALTLEIATFAEGAFDKCSKYEAKLRQFAEYGAQLKQEKIEYIRDETAQSLLSSFFSSVEYVHFSKQLRTLAKWMVAAVKVKQDVHQEDAAECRLKVETGKLDSVVPMLFGESCERDVVSFERSLEADCTSHETTDLWIKLKGIKMLLSHLPAAAEIPTNVFDPLVETFDFKQSSVGLNELEKKICLEIIVQCCKVLHKNMATKFDGITGMDFIGNALAIAKSAMKVFGMRVGTSPLLSWSLGLMGSSCIVWQICIKKRKKANNLCDV